MKRKIKLIIWPIIYLVLIINVCISFILVFRSYYYRSIFVSGSSMEPTLHGTVSDRVDYGIIDDHNSAINRIKRFQIITTYYPFIGSTDYKGGYVHGEENIIDENEASYKIKRVYALPGETIKFVVDPELMAQAKAKGEIEPFGNETQALAQQALQVQIKENGSDEFKYVKINFKRRIDTKKLGEYVDKEFVLGDDEYWVMGDNYSASSDCFSKKEPIYKDNIVGVLVAIEGTCKIDAHIDPNSTVDGTKISYQCKQRKRHFPTYY
ncbi:MAG: signal peptidase I [Bacilli bacterium]|nr:signal peptidase I [Bacilli bacterium]